MTDLASLTATEIASELDRGSLSSVELTRSLLTRAESKRGLNAFLDLYSDVALASAEEADKRRRAGERGPLLGVPVAIKDVILVKGTKTTCGSRMLANFLSPYDATVVSKLRKSGAVLFGKTNMDEFAMGSSTENSAFGPVQNPWNKAYVPGGSSGGSAAAVSARIAPLALGSDTGGSIRQPASFTGIVGMKPTYGRTSRYGLVAYASSLDQIGPFARSVKDCAHLLETISGFDPSDSTSMDVPVPSWSEELTQGIKGLRIGVPKQYFIEGLHPEVEQAVRAALQWYEGQGASLVEVDLPHTEAALSTYYILAPAEASSNLARFDGVRYGHRAAEPTDLIDLYCRSRSEGFGTEVKRRIMIGTYVLSSGYYDAFYLRAQKVRALIKNDFDKVFSSQCDLLACPTAPTPAFRIGEKVDDPLTMYLSDVFTITVNLAGLPGLSLPCGFSSSQLPIGLQLIGKPWDEGTLLRAAYAYEQQHDWHTRVPQ
ncbi:MAG: Asp-tRNA(Asn)/Glu-tRNA(Gln) amidotransferase subunit GatA [Bdellovibrionota bacterium]|nr:MAG: Asp-tRNA(Asn)/Glu-tRNA(Gln) amidotransferase subunit GatA [Bdellovibrionota bacterium]